MTLSVPGGAAVIEDPEDSPRASRAGRPPLERSQDPADMAGPSGTALRATIERLGMPLEVNADPVLARAQLEEFRKIVIREAKEVARTQEEYEMIVAEYNGAQEFAPVAKGPSRMNEVRDRGKNLNAEIDRDGRTRGSRTTSAISPGKPKYSSPAKTLRAAEAVIAGLPHLTGDALRRQQARANELVATANRQNAAYLKAKTGVADSKAIHSAGGAAASGASSPRVGNERHRSVNSARNKQLQAYDPAYAGHQVAAQGQMQAEQNRHVPAAPGQPPRHRE